MARWALERAGDGFREEPHLPIFSDLAALRRRQKPGVPVLITEDATLRGSTKILRWVDERGARLWPADPALAAEVDRWEDRCDRDLGPATRRLAYTWLIDDKDLALSLFKGMVPKVELGLMRRAFPMARAFMRRRLALDAASVQRAREVIDELLAEVGARLAGGRFLVGDQFTAADLAFGALAAPVLLPPGYGGPLPTLDQLAVDPRAEVARFRDTPAGRHALRLFSEERRA